jgi:hypothetical protein
MSLNDIHTSSYNKLEPVIETSLVHDGKGAKKCLQPDRERSGRSGFQCGCLYVHKFTNVYNDVLHICYVYIMYAMI